MRALFRKLDLNNDGTMSRTELQQGAVHNKEFGRLLRIMDINEEDLDFVFEITYRIRVRRGGFSYFLVCPWESVGTFTLSSLMDMQTLLFVPGRVRDGKELGLTSVFP